MKDVKKPSITKMLRRREVENRTGLKRSTIYDHIARGTFPRPTRIGPKIVAWPEHVIEAWLQEQIEKSTSALSAQLTAAWTVT